MHEPEPPRTDVERKIDELRRTVEIQRQQLEAMRMSLDALQARVLRDAEGRTPPRHS